MLPGESYPVLFSQRSRLSPPAFPESPIYPIAATTANSVNIFPQDRHLKTPRVHSYSAGIQRSIGRDMAFEVRYVGNQNLNTWAEEDWNERSVFSSGFFDEFKLAQRNLAANIAANQANRGYAYTGAPGTSPLPIHLAYLNGRSDASNPAAYTSANFTSPAFVNRFSSLRPQVTAAQGAIDTAAFRANALTAGLPRNLFVMNPMVSSSNVVADETGPTTTACSSSCAAGCRRACSWAPTTPTASRRRRTSPRWRTRASKSTSRTTATRRTSSK